MTAVSNQVQATAPVYLVAGAVDVSRTLLERRRVEYADALVDGWAGLGSKAISEKVLSQAATLISECAGIIDPVEIGPGRNGSLSVVWEEGPNYVHCNVGSDRSLHVYYKTTALGSWQAVGGIDDQWLRDRLRAALSFTRPFQGDVVTRQQRFTPSASSGAAAYRRIAA